MGKGNNVIPNGHFHKDWQERVKTWFNQPARKNRRQKARAEKARKVFPRPVSGPLRPLVHPPTLRYSMKVRLGKGFTQEELKEAGINRHEALSIGIAFDHRRRNRSEKSLKLNVQRLKEYKNKLVLFPKNHKKPKKGDATKEQMNAVTQNKDRVLMPVPQPHHKMESVPLKSLDTKASAVTELKKARTDARLVGIREKRAKKKEEEAALEKAKSSKTAE